MRSMDELNIQIKVLKEKKPTLFTWWNKETEAVEGCIITCHCQDLRLNFSSYAKLVKGSHRKSEDCFEVFSSDGTVKFAEVLEKAEILTLPKDTDCGSIFGRKVRTKQICDSSVLGSHGRRGKSKEVREEDTGDGWIALEESVDGDLDDGEDQIDSKTKKSIDIENCNDRTEGSHPVVENAIVNVEENTAPTLPANHGVTRIEGSLASVGQVVDVSTLPADSVVVLDESKGGLSEVDRALYEAFKGIIGDSEENESELSSLQQISRPSENLPKKSSELDSESLTEPINPVIAINTPAKTKPCEHKDEYLKKLHQLETMKKGVPIICEVCGALLTNRSFPNHMAAFHSTKERERKYPCEICGKRFLRRSDLKAHLVSHTDSRVYCSYCDKSFKHEYQRKAHEKVHSENPPQPTVHKLRCKTLNPIVRRVGETDEDLINRRRNNWQGPLKREGPKEPRSKPKEPKSKTVTCSTCGRVVSRLYMRKHMRRHDPKPGDKDGAKPAGNGRVACELCDKVLQKRFMKFHMNTVHNPKFVKCEICGQKVRKVNMYNHAKSHLAGKTRSHVCSYCSAAFHFKSSLDAHMREHSKERPIKCRFCDEAFAWYSARSYHEMQHTGERPYKCKPCQKDWKDRGTYREHMQKYHPGEPLMYRKCGPQGPRNQGKVKITAQMESTTE